MSEEPESLILRMLREMRAELASKPDLEALRREFATKSDLAELWAELKSDLHSLRTDLASDMLSMRRELSDQIVGLRRAVIDYHTTVIGHGVLISDLDARMRRVEQHLNLPPLVAI
jgi:hypothetical protein